MAQDKLRDEESVTTQLSDLYNVSGLDSSLLKVAQNDIYVYFAEVCRMLKDRRWL